jgi:hypothetical protein
MAAGLLNSVNLGCKFCLYMNVLRLKKCSSQQLIGVMKRALEHEYVLPSTVNSWGPRLNSSVVLMQPLSILYFGGKFILTRDR